MSAFDEAQKNFLDRLGLHLQLSEALDGTNADRLRAKFPNIDEIATDLKVSVEQWRLAAESLRNAEVGAPKECPQRRVVCSALKLPDGRLICGARHNHCFKRLVEFVDDNERNEFLGRIEQGFVDQWNVFMTREEAWGVAVAAGQIVRRCGGDDGRLFSENLY